MAMRRAIQRGYQPPSEADIKRTEKVIEKKSPGSTAHQPPAHIKTSSKLTHYKLELYEKRKTHEETVEGHSAMQQRKKAMGQGKARGSYSVDVTNLKTGKKVK